MIETPMGDHRLWEGKLTGGLRIRVSVLSLKSQKELPGA